jgi:hypothetical protein
MDQSQWKGDMFVSSLREPSKQACVKFKMQKELVSASCGILRKRKKKENKHNKPYGLVVILAQTNQRKREHMGL